MAVQSALTLNTKVYTPRGKTGDIALWALAGDTTFGGATSSVRESVRGPSAQGVNRVHIRLDIPKAATTDSACACTGQVLATGFADIVVVIPTAFTSAERDDFRLRIQGLIANAIFTSAVKDLEGSW